MRLNPDQCKEKTVYIVEANNNEKHYLWEQTKDHIEWRCSHGGILPTIGKLDERPICLSLLWEDIEGHIVMFWYPTSQVVDYKQIEEWLDKHFEGVKRVDATNHFLLSFIKEQKEKETTA